jgi:von Willebrand factor type A domain/Trypsin-like peptidase domain
MSHRLGSVISGAPIDIGPDAGPETSPNTWQVTFPVDPLAKFVMLHFNGTSLPSGDRLEVDLGYDTDVYRSTWGPDYWSRPIRGDQAVTIRYIRSGTGGGHVTLDKYGRGEAMAGGGSMNTNTDVFLLQSPYAEHSPAAQYAGGKFPPGSDPTWENVACVSDAVIVNTARSVGMYIVVDGDHLSSCTATLIAPDLLVTAGHCVSTDEEVKTGSITFDFQTDCDGNRPFGYNPKFHKLLRVIKSKYISQQIDYCVIQMVTPPGGLGLPIVPLRPDAPPVDEPLFIVHHPRGAIKKVSRYPIDPNCKALPLPPTDPGGRVYFNCDIDNGSSGSSIFDSAGRIVANLSQWEWGTSSPAMIKDIAEAPTPPKDVDVVLVFDRSGSMTLPGFGTSETKLDQAKRAAELFVSLLRTDKTHRVGLVTFSTIASPDFPLAAVNAGTKASLIGPPDPGLIDSIGAGGNTTIGGGLQTASTFFPPPGPAANSRSVLLLTDGLQNTNPTIETGEGALGSAVLNVIGFGTEASLDGPRLTRLAREHRGIYWRAEEGLSLKKYFALAFGNIFNFGTSLDPQFSLGAGVMAAPPIDVRVCGETMLTAILGWDNLGATLLVQLLSPGGSTITAASPGVIADSGSSWAHLRFALPFAGEQDGIWQVQVIRPGGGGEFPPPTPATNFFVSTLVEGGPVLVPQVQGLVYTGDIVNPLVGLSPPHGHHLHATVMVDIESPNQGVGNILTATGLAGTGIIDGDAIDQRTKKLIDLENASPGPLITTSKSTVPLFDDGAHDDGAMEEDGVFGNPLNNLARMEGTYTFHAVATYGHDCIAQREVTWSIYVAVGVDPATTIVVPVSETVLPDGRVRVCLKFVPRDRYGNYLGPGRKDLLQVTGASGSTADGLLTDNGDGSYVQCVIWDPDSGQPPGISIGQPGRPPVVLPDPTPRFYRYSVKFLCGAQRSEACCDPPVRPGKYATAISIYNPGPTNARIVKHVIPLVPAGAVVGREPGFAARQASDKTELPPGSATMDDCCRISELLLGAPPAGNPPMTIGILDIVSTKELTVSATYTVTDASAKVDMDIQNFPGRRT